MKRLNFAVRVTVAGMQRAETSGAANNERVRLQSEINNRPVIIDRSVFMKSEFEKEELKLAKSRWKRQSK